MNIDNWTLVKSYLFLSWYEYANVDLLDSFGEKGV